MPQASDWIVTPRVNTILDVLNMPQTSDWIGTPVVNTILDVLNMT